MKVRFDGCYLGDVFAGGRLWSAGDTGDVPELEAVGLVESGWFSSTGNDSDNDESEAV